ncbi:unnamed protein product [Cuscuta campestris]|uniref:Uncharacterized protein n=1 Tax=Cuscuta campestris TaxID=132261 RepID=A0A484LCC2_9ASTE|nr:unnamed protein product [Cuscuta campestris]
MTLPSHMPHFVLKSAKRHKNLFPELDLRLKICFFKSDFYLFKAKDLVLVMFLQILGPPNTSRRGKR